MKRLLLLLVVAVLVATNLVGCAKKVELGANINLFQGEDIPTLDANLATDAVSFDSLGNVMEGLVRLGQNADVVAGVAESWTFDEATLTWTFKLNKDAVWVNALGEKQRAVTAGDFVYSWDRLAAGEYQYTFMLADVAKIVSYTAVDDSTLEVVLAEKVPYFLNNMAFPSFYPIPAEQVEALGEGYGTTAEDLWYNGPFYMSKWDHSVEFVWTRNPEYWEAEVVRTPAVTFRVIEQYDVATGVALYDEGQIDRVGLSGEFVTQRGKDPDAVTVPDTAVFYLMINVGNAGPDATAADDVTAGNPLFDNLKVRQAVAKSIDKSYITDNILKNGSIPAFHLVPSDYITFNGAGYEDARGEGYMLTDKTAARALVVEGLTELGYAEGDNGLTIEILNYESATAGLIIEFVKQELDELFAGYGVTVNVTTLPFAQKLLEAEAGNFDITFAGWGPDYDWPTTYLDMWLTDGPYNEVGWSSAEYDALMTPAGKDDATVWADLQAAEGVFLNDAVVVPVYQRAGISLANPLVSGIVFHLSGYDTSLKWAYKEIAE
ncbi:MAG TPA: peptide ABC transporter substrate-binding protein [Erysipelotrichaceae bacterium]|nr:peptide ABC transporter substrate-binding protein [Erysipelotrichaceae bacterium]